MTDLEQEITNFEETAKCDNEEPDWEELTEPKEMSTGTFIDLEKEKNQV